MSDVICRQLGCIAYHDTWRAMRAFTDARDPDSPDELWVLEHAPVYTLGQAGRREHILNAGDIPIVESDRGGQVTYHGPGQLVIYTLFDLRRLGVGVRNLVVRIENAVIAFLHRYNIVAQGRRDAPGVYVNGAKIAALGLRVRKGCSYHGLALNVSTDLQPFAGINPCGYQGMQVVSLQDSGIDISLQTAADQLIHALASEFDYNVKTPILKTLPLTSE